MQSKESVASGKASGSPQAENTEFQAGDNVVTPPCTPIPAEESSQSSEGSYTDVFDTDADYDGPVYASQPSYVGKHGASYTPPGWKRIRVKRRKLIEKEESPVASSSSESAADD